MCRRYIVNMPILPYASLVFRDLESKACCMPFHGHFFPIWDMSFPGVQSILQGSSKQLMARSIKDLGGVKPSLLLSYL